MAPFIPRVASAKLDEIPYGAKCAWSPSRAQTWVHLKRWSRSHEGMHWHEIIGDHPNVRASRLANPSMASSTLHGEQMATKVLSSLVSNTANIHGLSLGLRLVELPGSLLENESSA